MKKFMNVQIFEEEEDESISRDKHLNDDDNIK